MNDTSTGTSHVVTTQFWDEVVRTQSAGVYRLSYRLTGNPHDAADLTQDVFVQLFRSFSAPAEGNLEAWLRRVTTNRFFDQLRRKRRIRFETLADHASEQIPSLEPTPPQVVNDQTVDDDVRAALDALSPGVRAAVLLCDIEGVPHSEVAAILGIGVNAARTRIYRGRAELRDALIDRAPRQVERSPVRVVNGDAGVPGLKPATPPGGHTGATAAASDDRR